MKLRLYLFPALAWLLVLQPAMAQEVKLISQWEEDEVGFFQGKLHRIKCSTVSETNQSLKLIVKPEAPLKLLSPASYRISAAKDQPSYANIKVYFPQTAGAVKDSLKVEFILQSQENEAVVAQRNIIYDTRERMLISLETPKPQLPINAGDTAVLLPLQLKNRGKKSYEVGIDVRKKPQGLKILESPGTLLLGAQADTVVHYQVRPDKSWAKTHSTTLNFMLKTLSDDKEVADGSIKAFPLVNEKKYTNPELTDNSFHLLDMSFQNRGQGQNSLQLGQEGHLPFGQGHLSYAYQTSYYSQYRSLEFSGTHFNYLTGGHSYSIGNISYSNGEASAGGRGISYVHTRDSQQLQLGLIDEASDLFASASGGQHLYGAYSGMSQKYGHLGISGVFSRDKYASQGVVVFTGNMEKEEEYVNARIALSSTNSRAPSAMQRLSTGYSLGLDFNKNWQGWELQSDNSYSSPHHSGGSPGVIQSSNQIKYSGWERLTLKAAFRGQNSSKPVIISDQIFQRISRFARYQIQLETKRPGRWKLSMNPYHVMQRRNFIDNTQPDQLYIQSATHVKTSIRYKQNKFALMVKGDIGRAALKKEGELNAKAHPYWLGFQLSKGKLALHATYRKGSAYLTDAVEATQNGRPRFDFQTGLRWGTRFFDKRVKTNFSYQLSYQSLRDQWSHVPSARAETRILNDLTVHLEYLLMTTGNFKSPYMRLNLVKRISTHRSTLPKYHIRVKVFEDKNNNKIQDESEAVLPGIFVRINGIPFVADEEGYIVYKAVPPGEYIINAIDPQGRLVADQSQIMLEKNTSLEIGLFKTSVLRGTVKELKQRFKQMKFDINGIPVVAKNSQDETLTTYTLSDGSFSFYLPENDYVVYVDPAAFGDSMEFPDNYIRVELRQGETKEVTLSVKVKSRKMKIQKF